MTIYVAGSWHARDVCRQIRKMLQDAGHTVTSRWLDVEHEDALPGHVVARREALRDFADIDAADVLVVSNGTPSATGGFHIETGYALAKRKPVILIGDRSTVFHHLPRIFKVGRPEQVVNVLAMPAAVWCL